MDKTGDFCSHLDPNAGVTDVPRRPPPPKRKLLGVRHVWSGRAWKFRAYVKRRGKPYVGSVRTTQEEAHADYVRIKSSLRGGIVAPGAQSLGAAIGAITDDMSRRGIPDTTIKNTTRMSARFLYKFFPASLRLSKIDAEAVSAFILWARDQGRHANTLLEKDLPLLARAFRAVGMESPVGEARKRHRNLQRIATLPDVLPWDRVCKHLDTIRTDKRQRAEFHADLFELAAFTGIRSGEIARLRGVDLDWRGCAVRIPSPKVHHRPRVVPTPQQLRPVLKRLSAAGENRLVDGGMPTLSSMVRRWKVRLGEPTWTFRTLRRSYASFLAAQGVNIHEIRELLGHSSLDTTTRYVRALPGARRRTVDRVLGNGAGEHDKG